jgi:hypothetical protein
MTKHKMKTKFEKDVEPEGTAGGWFLLIAAGCGVMAAIFAMARDVGILLVWAVGSYAIYRAAKNVRGAANPAPPPAPECHEVAQPQVTMVRDTEHSNRWVVAQKTPWLNWAPDNDNETGTSP